MSEATVAETFNGVRLNSEECTSKWFQKAVDIATEINVLSQEHRTTGKQIPTKNMPAEDIM